MERLENVWLNESLSYHKLFLCVLLLILLKDPRKRVQISGKITFLNLPPPSFVSDRDFLSVWNLAHITCNLKVLGK